MAFRLLTGRNPVFAYQALELIVNELPRHLVEPQLQYQSGVLKVVLAELANRCLVDPQLDRDPGRGPALLQSPQDESPLPGGQPAMPLVGPAGRQVLGEALI